MHDGDTSGMLYIKRCDDPQLTFSKLPKMIKLKMIFRVLFMHNIGFNYVSYSLLNLI